MARQRYDLSSKWLLHNQARGALLVGGLKDVRRIEPGPGEIAQSRKYPDGLLRVYLRGERTPHYVLIEVATYAEARVLKQALDDLTLAYSALGHLPELLILVLCARGTLRVGGHHEVSSKLGLSRLQAEWRPVELWTLQAEEFLAQGDVGVVPWVPLMHSDGPAESLLERCAERIEREAPPRDRGTLLGVTQVLGTLRFPEALLAEFLGGEQIMLELPVMQRMRAKTLQKGILAVLTARFETVPRDVTRHLGKILDENRLTDLLVRAGQCQDLDAFRMALRA